MCGIPSGQKAGIESWWLYPVLVDWSSVIACFNLSLTDDTSTISVHESCRYCSAQNNMDETTYSKSGRPPFSHEVVETPKNSTVPEAQHRHTLTRHWSSHGKLITSGKPVKPQRLLELSLPYALCFCYQNYQSGSERLSVKSVFTGDIIVKQRIHISIFYY